ncbi:hypothetical protein P1T37_25320, partial [Escherichia coli]|nr:hypothetical protein [Escherichia coli]
RYSKIAPCVRLLSLICKTRCNSRAYVWHNNKAQRAESLSAPCRRKTMRDDDLEHLSANYWITTVLCGLFLGIFLFMLQQHQRGLALYCIAALSLICAFFSLRLSRQLQHMKKERRNIRPH